jgi:hypothetical protein
MSLSGMAWRGTLELVPDVGPAPKLRCILAWCAASVSPEALDEVTLIGEADCDGNFGHRPIAFAEQLSSQLDATTLEMPHGCHTGAGSKQADETKAAGSRHATQFVESDMFSDLIVHVGNDRSEGRRVKPSYRIVAWMRAGIVVASQLRGQHRRYSLHKQGLSGM